MMIDIEKIKKNFNKNKKIYIKYLIITIIIIFFIRYIFLLYNFNFKYKTDKATKKYNVLVIRNIELSNEKISYLVKYERNNFILNIYKDEFVKEKISDEEFLDKYSKFNYGDKIEYRCKMIIPEKLNNPYEFNYKLYLNSKNIVGVFSCYEAKKVSEIFGNPFFKTSYFLREDIGKNVDSKLLTEEAALFKSMIYGDDRTLADDIKENFQKDGISHIISVSGSNIATMLLIFFMFLNPKNKKVKIILYGSVIYMFCLIAAMELSIIRASIMAILSIIFNTFNLKINTYLKLLISFLFMFIYNPWCILNAGLILSFFSIIGIILYNQTITSYFNVVLMKKFEVLTLDKNSFKYYMYILFLYILKTFAVIISVLILIFPLQIYYFGEFQILSIFFNVIISFFVFIQSIFGFISLFLTYIPYLSDQMLNINFVILKLIIYLSKCFAKFDFLSLNIPRPHILIIIIYYLFLLVYIFKEKFIYKIDRIKRQKIILTINLLTFIYILLVIGIYVYNIYFEEYIYFFNVGQGNMAIIREDRKTIVVDMGSTTKNLATSVLNNFLKAKSIRKIDIIMLTHMHDDHINGLEGVILNEDVKILNVLYTKPKDEKNEEFIKIQKLIEENNISKIEVEEYDCIEYLNFKIDILSPPKDKKIIAKDEINANSLILLFSKNKGNKKENYLFMGDATIESDKSFIERLKNNDSNKRIEIEEKLKNIKVLQVGHHGSKTSTSDELLKYINVKNCVISAKKEKFGHPHEEVLNKLKEKNITIKTTELDGAIKY